MNLDQLINELQDIKRKHYDKVAEVQDVGKIPVTVAGRADFEVQVLITTKNKLVEIRVVPV
jgi:hypothetical protein